MAGQGWPKRARLRKRPEFLRVQSQNLKASGQNFTALARPNKRGITRLGVTVSSKVGNSVVRNQVKRWVREAFRTHPAWWPPNLDIVLIAKPGADKNTYVGVCRDLERMAKALGAKVPRPGAASAPPKR